MENYRIWRKLFRVALACVGIVTAAGLGFLVLIQVQAAVPIDDLAAEVEPAQNPYRAIGLPVVSSFALQNINVLGSSLPTSTTIKYISPDGTEQERYTDPALAAESVSVFVGPDDPADLARIEYEEVAGGGNLLFGVNFESTSAGNAAYLGLDLIDTYRSERSDDQAAYVNYIMTLMKNAYGWTSGFTLQNRSPDSDANVAVSFYDQSGSPACFFNVATPIPANGSVSFYLLSSGFDCLPDGFIGSAVVEADQPVSVGSVKTCNTQLGICSAYRGVNMGEATLAAPALFKDYYSLSSILCVQNVGIDPAFVQVLYTDGEEVTTEIAPVAVQCLDQRVEAHGDHWSGGAAIYGNMPLVAVVHVTAYESNTPVGRWSYTATGSEVLRTQRDQSLAFPVVFNDSDGWTSAIYLYNLSDQPVEITPRYVSRTSGYVHCPQRFTIPAGGTLAVPQSELPRAMGEAMAYFNTAGPVAAAVGVYHDPSRGAVTDRLFGYRAAYPGVAVSFPDTCDQMIEVFVPLILRDMP